MILFAAYSSVFLLASNQRFAIDSIHYDFPTDEYTMHLVFGHMQVYNKKFPDGKTRIRVEQQLDINNTIEEVINSSMFQKASELERSNET